MGRAPVWTSILVSGAASLLHLQRRSGDKSNNISLFIRCQDGQTAFQRTLNPLAKPSRNVALPNLMAVCYVVLVGNQVRNVANKRMPENGGRFYSKSVPKYKRKQRHVFLEVESASSFLSARKPSRSLSPCFPTRPNLVSSC